MKTQYCLNCGSELIDKLIDGETRFACSKDCGYVLWNNPVPVVAAIVIYEDKVLLARNAAWPEGIFALVTGFLEKGEDPFDGIKREVKEELNLESTDVNLIGLYPFEKMNQLIIAYEVKASGEIELNEELAEYKLIEPHKLRAWEMGTGLAVKDWIKNRVKSLKSES